MTEQPASAKITINHPLGLHLRKSKDVVQVANRYDAHITAQNLTRRDLRLLMPRASCS